MSKEFSFPNKGTCSKQTNFVLNDDHTIASIEVIGGCNVKCTGSWVVASLISNGSSQMFVYMKS